MFCSCWAIGRKKGKRFPEVKNPDHLWLDADQIGPDVCKDCLPDLHRHSLIIDMPRAEIQRSWWHAQPAPFRPWLGCEYLFSLMMHSSQASIKKLKATCERAMASLRPSRGAVFFCIDCRWPRSCFIRFLISGSSSFNCQSNPIQSISRSQRRQRKEEWFTSSVDNSFSGFGNVYSAGLLQAGPSSGAMSSSWRRIGCSWDKKVSK